MGESAGHGKANRARAEENSRAEENPRKSVSWCAAAAAAARSGLHFSDCSRNSLRRQKQKKSSSQQPWMDAQHREQNTESNDDGAQRKWHQLQQQHQHQWEVLLTDNLGASRWLPRFPFRFPGPRPRDTFFHFGRDSSLFPLSIYFSSLFPLSDSDQWKSGRKREQKVENINSLVF